MVTVAEWAMEEPVTAQAGSTLRHCLRKVLVSERRHVVVTDARRRAIGLVYDFQILRRCGRRGGLPIPAAGAAERPAFALGVGLGTPVRPDQPTHEVLDLLTSGWEDAVVVVDGERRPVGLATVEGALALAPGWLTPWWTVRQAFRPSDTAFRVTAPVRTVLGPLMREHGGYSLVSDRSRVVGLVDPRRAFAVAPGRHATLAEVVAEEPLAVVDVEATLVSAAEVLARRRLGAVVVVDGRRPVGILAAVDVVRAIRRAMVGVRVALRDAAPLVTMACE